VSQWFKWYLRVGEWTQIPTLGMLEKKSSSSPNWSCWAFGIFRAACPIRPSALLADLVRQPSARVRNAVIAVLLAYPDYAEAVPAALERLRPAEQQTLRLFYTAAVLLQQEYTD
jgi:hypothetical protein